MILPAVCFTRKIMHSLQRQYQCLYCLRQYAPKSPTKVQQDISRTLQVSAIPNVSKLLHHASSQASRNIPSISKCLNNKNSGNLRRQQYLPTLTRSAKDLTTSSSHLPLRLTADHVFSSDTRKQMSCRISQVQVPRSLFKKITKHAGILVPLCTVGGEPAVLLTLRSANLTTHRGEVSFPGGIYDDKDDDIIATALRETDEELGIRPDDVDVWCQMAPVPNKTRETAVHTVVGFIGEVDVRKLQLNANEVECAFTIPLSILLDPVNQRYTRFLPRQVKDGQAVTGPLYTLPVFDGGRYRIWGLSAVILDAVLQTWLPEHYTSMMVKLKLYGQK